MPADGTELQDGLQDALQEVSPSPGKDPSTERGVHLTSDEHSLLVQRLDEFGLSSRSWDSLDVECVLALVEHEFGVSMPVNVRPGRLTSLEVFEEYLGNEGERRLSEVVRARYSFSGDLNRPGVFEGVELERQRRLIEYRLALSAADVRFGVSRSGPLQVIAVSRSAELLPDPAFVESVSTLELATTNERRSVGQTGFNSEQHFAQRLATFPDSFANAPTPAKGELTNWLEHVETTLFRFVASKGGYWAPPPSPVITVDRLRRLGYFDAHPEQVVLLNQELALSPAACLNMYDYLLDKDNLTIVCALGTVFRVESRYNSMRRLAFSQRELLWKVNVDDNEAMALEVMSLWEEIATDLNLSWMWRYAEDAFFLATGGAPRTKVELVVDTQQETIAIASVNRHGSHFTSRGYGDPHTEVTGCSSFGMERLALVLNRNGIT